MSVARVPEDVIATVWVTVDGQGVGMIRCHYDQRLLRVHHLQSCSHRPVQLQGFVQGLPARVVDDAWFTPHSPGLVAVVPMVYESGLYEDDISLLPVTKHPQGSPRHVLQTGVIHANCLLKAVLKVSRAEDKIFIL